MASHEYSDELIIKARRKMEEAQKESHSNKVVTIQMERFCHFHSQRAQTVRILLVESDRANQQPPLHGCEKHHIHIDRVQRLRQKLQDGQIAVWPI